jgi:hypothetical protein
MSSVSLPVAAANPRARTALRLCLLVCLYAAPVVVALRPVGDPVPDADVWQHLRTGQWIDEHGAVPQTDPFSRYGQGRPWVAYSWLFEAALYGLYARLGLAAVVAYRVALSFAVTAAVHRLVARREPRFHVAVLLTGVALLPLSMLFNERPWLFTILFSTLALDVVLDMRSGRPNRLTWALPAVFALWANLHIQFVYGLLLLALACVAPALDRLTGRRADGACAVGSGGWRRLLVLSSTCAAATLLNPYHVRLYGVVIEYATQPGAFHLINEFKSLEFRDAFDWVVLGLAGAAAFALGRRKGLSAFDVLLLAGAAFLSFRARRDLWCVVGVALATLANGRRAEAVAGGRLPWTSLRAVAFTAGLGAVAVLAAWRCGLSEQRLHEAEGQAFPMRAADFVLEQGYDGPVYNHMDWGSYLAWRWPHLPVAIDGRTNLHGDERLERFQRTWLGQPGWRDDPDLEAANLVIGSPTQPLTALLRSDERFGVAYEDEQAVVFVRRRGAFARSPPVN